MSTVCSDCGAAISCSNDSENFRAPCSSCGGTKRTINVSINETIGLRDFIGVKAKRLGQKRPYVEDISKPSFSHDKQKVVHRHTFIDRDSNIYSEKVTDIETAEVIHQNQEPLSAHTGHGSAKFKKNPVDK